MGRCFGLTTSLNRCQRSGSWRFFCPEHKKQPLIWVFTFIFTIGGGTASIYSVLKSDDKSPVLPQAVAEANKETKKAVRATGVGLPPTDITDPAQKYYMAKRAAEVDAMRKLAEAIGASVKSESRVDKGKMDKDYIETKIDRILKGAYIVSTQKNQDNTVEVIMEAPIDQ